MEIGTSPIPKAHNMWNWPGPLSANRVSTGAIASVTTSAISSRRSTTRYRAGSMVDTSTLAVTVHIEQLQTSGLQTVRNSTANRDIKA